MAVPAISSSLTDTTTKAYTSTIHNYTKEYKVPVKYTRQGDEDTDQLIVRDFGDLYCESYCNCLFLDQFI